MLASSLLPLSGLQDCYFLVLVPAKHCSEITLLCVDTQHLFCSIIISVPLPAGKIDHLGHLPSQIRIESPTNVGLALFFIEGLFKLY